MLKKWFNWYGNYSACPAGMVAPATVDEVVAAVNEAVAANQVIRVVGGGFSWSPLVPVDGCLISTENLRRIRSIDVERFQLTVEPGATVGEVVEVAARHGMSVKSTSMFLGLSVGGLIATGSHGTGKHYATFGDNVVGFELVTADGSIVTETTPGSDLWRAVITSVGALGVLTAVTLQCEPLFNVHEVHQAVPVGDVAALLPVLQAEYEFVSLFWYPCSKWAHLKLGNRSPFPAEKIKGRIKASIPEKAVGWFGWMVPKLLSVAPFMREFLFGVMNAASGTGSRVIEEPYFSHYQQVYPSVISSEFGVPVAQASAAFSWIRQRLTQFDVAGVRPVNLVVHARFGCASRAFISSSAGRDTCHLEMLSFKGNPHRELFRDEVEEAMCTLFEGKPHWGKDLSNPWRAARAHEEGLQKFLAVRRAVDPQQRFLNPYLRDEVFGLARRQAVDGVAATERIPAADVVPVETVVSTLPAVCCEAS